MNVLCKDKRALILNALIEGMGVRATARLADVAINSVIKLLIASGKACLKYQQETLVNLPCKRIQCDEIWSFCYAKEKNCSKEMKAKNYGDCWTWTALCDTTKLVPSWYVGTRDSSAAYHFMHDLASRLSSRVQITTDGHRAYLSAVESAFGSEIDYGMLVKIYGSQPESDIRYSPAQYMGAKKTIVAGMPNEKRISTSYTERHNLNMRMQMRRFTRLTNGYSKKFENLCHSVSLYMMAYNFHKIHSALRVTPAMEAGVADHPWEISEIVDLIDESKT